MTTYCRPSLLAEALDSVLAQSVRDFECLVVDDASPEPPVLPTDPRVRLIRRTTNGGPAAARNTGIANAQGRYLTFLDDDDRYTPDRLALASSGLSRAPVALCWSRFIGDDKNVARGRSLDGDVSDVIRDGMTPHVGQTAVDRSVIVPFDERFRAAEDVDWWLRLAPRARVATVPEVGFLFRRRPGPESAARAASRFAPLQQILDLHADYFDTRPRAAAFQLSRIGITAMAAGDGRAARQALRRSFMLRPSGRSAYHFARSCTIGRR